MSEIAMIIIEHLLDLFAICISNYLLYRETIQSKLRAFCVILLYSIATLLNCYFDYYLQPIHAVLMIASFVVLYGITRNRIFNSIILYFLLSSIQIYIYDLLILWNNNHILSLFNLIGDGIMIFVCFALCRMDSSFNIRMNKVFFLLFLLVSLFAEGMTMAVIKLLVKEYSIKLDIFDVSILTLSFPLVMILMFLYFHQVSKRNIEFDRRIFLERLLKNEQQHFEEQEKILSSLRKYKHDSKNFYNIIISLLNKNNFDELLNFVENAKKGLEDIDYQLYTGNTIGDVIINQKKRVCENKKIAFDYDGIIPTTNNLSNTELASLLSNIIDNAIEAALKTESGYVKVISRCDNKFLKITVANSFQGKINIDMLETTKINKEEHGYGIQIIKSIVNRNEGEVFFSIREQEFKTEVLLKI